MVAGWFGIKIGIGAGLASVTKLNLQQWSSSWYAFPLFVCVCVRTREREAQRQRPMGKCYVLLVLRQKGITETLDFGMGICSCVFVKKISKNALHFRLVN